MASKKSATANFDTFFLANAASSDIVCASLDDLRNANNLMGHDKVGCGSLSGVEKTLPRSALSSETPF